MTPTDLAWESRWKAVRPTAEYHAAYGLEGAWRANADDWGYPLEDAEQSVEVDGQMLPGRTFSGVGLVVWTDAGERMIGWPQ
jgi:hypothetical protein